MATTNNVAIPNQINRGVPGPIPGTGRTNMFNKGTTYLEQMNARIANIQERIAKGKEDKSLTQEEINKMNFELANLKTHKQNALKDKKLTHKEKKDLEKELSALSRDVYGERHDSDGKKLDKPKNNGKPTVATKEFKEYVHSRYQWQNERLQNGKEDGSLTKSEYKDLKKDMKAIKNAERLFMKDGNLNEEERLALMDMQDTLSKEIYEARHNRDGIIAIDDRSDEPPNPVGATATSTSETTA